MSQILAKKMIIDESTAYAEPKHWARGNVSNLCVMFAGTPSWDTEVDAVQVSQICGFVYKRLVDLQFFGSSPSEFELLIRSLFMECDQRHSCEFFLSAGIVIKTNSSVFVATVGYVEAWLVKEARIARLTSPTTLTLPNRSRSKVLLSSLGLNVFQGVFSHATYTDCGCPLFLLANGSTSIGADSPLLVPYLKNTTIPTEFANSLDNCSSVCILL